MKINSYLIIFLAAFLTTSALTSAPLFEDQVVIVTGASRGIGKGIAKTFAQEGATVILVARNESDLQLVHQEITEQGGHALVLLADVGCSNAVQKVIDQTLSAFGHIDVLCHNAGIYPEVRLEDMTLEEWNRVIQVNLTSTFLMVNRCIPAMKSQRGGKIVITSSISGPITGLPGFSHYTASKGGVSGFIKTAAIELAKYNIQINSVEPGNILTEGLSELGKEYLTSMTRAIPANKLGTVEDIAHATLFLASHRADFITGQSLTVDGGQTLPESHFSEY